MNKNARQYTIRNIPDQVDRALKRRAKEAGKSFNQVALEALASGAGESLRPKRDFSEVIGSLSEKEAMGIEEEIRLQHQIDPRLWK
jgi:plasmid stability protein